MKNKTYTREELLKIMKGYLRMIKRSGEEFPTVVLDDIEKSIKYVLEVNDYNRK